MKKSTYKYILLFAVLLIANLDIFAQFNYKGSLFSDVKASDIDDAITILIVEDTKAQSGVNTGLSKQDVLDAGLGGSIGAIAAGNAGADINAGSNFQANATNSRTETIRTKLSARIIDVEATGNLIIRGERTTKINGEEQKVIIEGTIRPVDILPDNTVYSYSIMDLKLTIEGNGNLTETQEPGLITKFLRVLF